MWIQFEHAENNVRIDANVFFDLSIAIGKRNNVNCYYLDDPDFTYFESPEFTGSLEKGGSVNCEKISLYPHASGTHTECALHVVKVDFDMRHVEIPPFMMCRLVSVLPSEVNNDRVIDKLEEVIFQNFENYTAIIIRTLPNETNKQHRNYSGSNPPYFEPELLTRLREAGYKHILCDLPSIDKESDEGRLSAHKNWFLENGKAYNDRTITELIFIRDEIKDGSYALSIQRPSIETDAVPSRILIYPCS